MFKQFIVSLLFLYPLFIFAAEDRSDLSSPTSSDQGSDNLMKIKHLKLGMAKPS